MQGMRPGILGLPSQPKKMSIAGADACHPMLLDHETIRNYRLCSHVTSRDDLAHWVPLLTAALVVHPFKARVEIDQKTLTERKAYAFVKRLPS
jgi:hypothetical protein